MARPRQKYLGSILAISAKPRTNTALAEHRDLLFGGFLVGACLVRHRPNNKQITLPSHVDDFLDDLEFLLIFLGVSFLFLLSVTN